MLRRGGGLKPLAVIRLHFGNDLACIAVDEQHGIDVGLKPDDDRYVAIHAGAVPRLAVHGEGIMYAVIAADGQRYALALRNKHRPGIHAGVGDKAYEPEGMIVPLGSRAVRVPGVGIFRGVAHVHLVRAAFENVIPVDEIQPAEEHYELQTVTAAEHVIADGGYAFRNQHEG